MTKVGAHGTRVGTCQSAPTNAPPVAPVSLNGPNWPNVGSVRSTRPLAAPTSPPTKTLVQLRFTAAGDGNQEAWGLAACGNGAILTAAPPMTCSTSGR